MASVAEIGLEVPAPRTSGGAVEFVDRWIWVFMAALFVVTVLVGFVPDSIAKVGAIEAGARPPFPPILHVHAALMGSWMALLLTQSTLMATGRSAWHKQLGMLSFGLAPAMVVAGFVLVPTMYGMAVAGLRTAHNVPLIHGVPQPLYFATNILLFQIRTGLMFAICAAIAIWARRHDTGLHKRMMVLVTALPLPASIDRMEWLPNTMPFSPTGLWLYTLLLISPLFLWDLYRLRRVHRAYWLWLALFAPSTVAIQLLWNSPWWFATVPKLMGVS